MIYCIYKNYSLNFSTIAPHKSEADANKFLRKFKNVVRSFLPVMSPVRPVITWPRFPCVPLILSLVHDDRDYEQVQQYLAAITPSYRIPLLRKDLRRPLGSAINRDRDQRATRPWDPCTKQGRLCGRRDRLVLSSGVTWKRGHWLEAGGKVDQRPRTFEGRSLHGVQSLHRPRDG